jgi:orotate phosphoribosyltransferase
MTKTDLAREVFRLAHRTGQFKLRSGQMSNEYFDKYQFESQPKVLREIARMLIPLLPKDTELLGALEMGGIPIATAIALETGHQVVFVRKQPKDYGTCRFAEGPEIRGRKITLIEDVITTGGQIVISATDLRKDGAIITDVVGVIDRSEGKREKLDGAGLKLAALFTMAELKNAGQNVKT